MLCQYTLYKGNGSSEPFLFILTSLILKKLMIFCFTFKKVSKIFIFIFFTKFFLLFLRTKRSKKRVQNFPYGKAMPYGIVGYFFRFKGRFRYSTPLTTFVPHRFVELIPHRRVITVRAICSHCTERFIGQPLGWFSAKPKMLMPLRGRLAARTSRHPVYIPLSRPVGASSPTGGAKR